MLALQAKRQGLQQQPENSEGPDHVGLGEEGHFDTDIYDAPKQRRLEGYVTSIAATEEVDVSIYYISSRRDDVIIGLGPSVSSSALASHCFGHSNFMGRRQVNSSPTRV